MRGSDLRSASRWEESLLPRGRFRVGASAKKRRIGSHGYSVGWSDVAFESENALKRLLAHALAHGGLSAECTESSLLAGRLRPTPSPSPPRQERWSAATFVRGEGATSRAGQGRGWVGSASRRAYHPLRRPATFSIQSTSAVVIGVEDMPFMTQCVHLLLLLVSTIGRTRQRRGLWGRRD